jgi:hypothetical protein
MGSKSISGMRRQEVKTDAASHDNRSLTPLAKKFAGDEMGTTPRGRSHLCFYTHPLSANSQIKFTPVIKPMFKFMPHHAYFECFIPDKVMNNC